MSENILRKILRTVEKGTVEWLLAYGLTLLQASLSGLFLYFGGLKLAGISPYRVFFQVAFPQNAADAVIASGLMEVALGVLLFLLFIKLPRVSEIIVSRFVLFLTLVYIAAIVATFLFSSANVFSPVFPELTIFGDQALRTLAMLFGVLLVVAQRYPKKLHAR